MAGRVEDRRLLTGRASYVGNLSLPRMLHMRVIRSPHAHALIQHVDTTEAMAATGVVGVFTGADLAGKVQPMPASRIPGMTLPDHLPLAVDRVRFVGEPVAVVVAESVHAAVDAAALVDIDYEPVHAVVEPEDALEPDTPLIHEELGTNVAMSFSAGAPTPALDTADVVIRQRMVNQRVIHCPLETRGVIADYRSFDDSLVLHLSTQAPHLIKTKLSEVLGIPEHKTRIVTGDVGGAFGSKLNVYPEDVLAAVASRTFDRPVKWVEERSEAMSGACHGRSLTADVQMGATKDGKVTALHVSLLSDIGAYPGSLPSTGALLTGLMLSGSYKIPEITFDAKIVFTNKTPVEPYRGYYRAEATYFLERSIDLLADELGLDPAEIRQRNFIGAEEFPYRTATGQIYDSGDYHANLQRALDIADYAALREEQRHQRQQGRYLGIGISAYTWRAGFTSKGMGASSEVDFLPGGWESAVLRVERSGGVTVRTGALPHGQGLQNALAGIVSEQLGVPESDVTVVYGDTETTPYGMGSEGSRSLVTAGPAVLQAADRVRGKATELAAHLLEAAPDDLEWQNDTIAVRGVPDNHFTLYELARIASQGTHRPEGMDPGLEATAVFDPDDFNYPAGAHVCLVEVDPDTGQVRILRHIAVDDCGRRVHPTIVEGQIHGSTAQGIAQALFEEASYDPDGQLLTGNFSSYHIPTAADLPSFETADLPTSTSRNPLGAKGAGEAGTIGAPPAVVNAVLDALNPYGITHLDMPLTPERIWRALVERQAVSAPAPAE